LKISNKLIKKKKIKTYQLEKISFSEQINLLNNSRIVIGAHGAALANIIFCKPNTRIVEIIPSNHPNRQTERISKILNLKYFRIKTKPTKFDVNYPFKIFLTEKDLNKIEKIINS
jgi:capsular polysaccharide biosynthesis protein